MTATAEKLKSELVGLSADDRANLAHFLIQSLPAQPLDDAGFDAELERRADEIKTGKATGEPLDKVVTELRQQFS